MSRISSRFTLLKSVGRRALIPFITAGDPTPADTVTLMNTLVQSGADIIELGVPFSDPMADGPVIQAASERALRHHVTLARVLEMVREFREADVSTPVILMGYTNPVEAMGYEHFCKQAQQAGVDGVIIVDLPPEEAEDYLRSAKSYDISPIFLLSPTTSTKRAEYITNMASGFLYYVSLRGVTGATHFDTDEMRSRIAKIRECTDLPIAIGFGVNTPERAAAVAKIADAVVVGSALVQKISEHGALSKELLADIDIFMRGLHKAIGVQPTKKQRGVSS